MNHRTPPPPASASRGGGRSSFLHRGLAALYHCVGWRLVIILTVVLSLLLAVTGAVLDRMQRAHMIEVLEDAALGMGSTILSATHAAMLENNREHLGTIITRIGETDQVHSARLIEAGGEIRYSSVPGEVGTHADVTAAACRHCHLPDRILVPEKLADGLTLYGLPQGGQALGLAVPVLNSPECYNAACHYHRPEQQVLGVLDLKLSTEHLDAALHVQQSRYRLSMLLVTLILCSVVGWLAWKVVHRPVHALLDGTRRLASGDLAHRIPDQSIGEIHELAESFNTMAQRLQSAQQALEEWNRTLEQRVAQKTKELEKARDQLVLTEKMVSLGKLSAIVAHEINNPLAGILVTIKLLRRRLPRLLGESAGEEEARKAEEKLALVEKETARCGDVVRNLLLFSRRREISRRSEELPPIVDRCLKLVAHQAELQQVDVRVEQDPDLPPVTCDPDEIEQACLVLIMNAIDAMPDGGELRVRIKHLTGPKMVRVEVQDNGVGIPPEIQGRIFEPFYSTKTEGQGTGLGLSVLYGVVQRHQGRVDFRSRPGEGSTFWIDLPLRPPPLPIPSSPLGDSSQREVIDS